MDDLFSSLALQTVQLVGKAAFGAAGTLALKRVTSYVGQAQEAKEPQATLERLLARFEARLRIVTPAIDLVEIIAARGHSTLAGALHLTHSLRKDILAIGSSSSSGSPAIAQDLRNLIEKIDDSVPLLNLALTTSGAHLGATLPEGVSPARLMQASALLSHASPDDGKVGSPFVLRLYSMFAASVRPKSSHDFTWKEEFVKCRLTLCRSTSEDQVLAYELRILEDTNDGRYHEEQEEKNKKSGGEELVVPLDRVRSMYYTSTGSLLNIEDSTSPVLVLSVSTATDDTTTTDSLKSMADFGKVDSTK
ncbi:Ran-specific GTPase-activating protein 30, partial [Coemansia aciculifera]